MGLTLRTVIWEEIHGALWTDFSIISDLIWTAFDESVGLDTLARLHNKAVKRVSQNFRTNEQDISGYFIAHENSIDPTVNNQSELSSNNAIRQATLYGGSID